MFVGPFSNKLDGPSDVITLDDDDDDEVQEVPPAQKESPANQQQETSNQPAPSRETGSKRPLLTADQRRFSREVRAQAVMGQVPQVVARETDDGGAGEEDIVVLVNEDVTQGG